MATEGKRPASLAEARALAHPLRQRILRLCLDEELTNKQLADRLGQDPATVFYHVRTLVSTGFLAAGEVRSGATGALEKPYRATGKSWTLDVTEEVDPQSAVSLAALEAFRDELLESGPGSVEGMYRLGLTLTKASHAELNERLSAIVHEFAARRPDRGGKPYGLFVAIHRRAHGRPSADS